MKKNKDLNKSMTIYLNISHLLTTIDYFRFSCEKIYYFENVIDN
eukprot:UN14907